MTLINTTISEVHLHVSQLIFRLLLITISAV